MLLAEVPFAGRIWGRPVLTALTPSKAWCEHHKQRYRPVTEWAERLLLTLHRWLPDRVIVAVMDGEFAAIDLLHRLRRYMVVITRLRLDACLFDPPSEYKGRGRCPKKGARQPSLKARITDPATVWKRAVQASRTSWRSGGWIEYASGTALWYHAGKEPLPSAADASRHIDALRASIRWVLLRDPQGQFEPQALLCTNPMKDPLCVIGWFVQRWPVEVTFREVRDHLGFESQRQWSDAAIGRTTPCLLGLFSLVALFASQLAPRTRCAVWTAAWYRKQQPTFADTLAAVRREIWKAQGLSISRKIPDMQKLPQPLRDGMIHALCYAA